MCMILLMNVPTANENCCLGSCKWPPLTCHSTIIFQPPTSTQIQHLICLEQKHRNSSHLLAQKWTEAYFVLFLRSSVYIVLESWIGATKIQLKLLKTFQAVPSLKSWASNLKWYVKEMMSLKLGLNGWDWIMLNPFLHFQDATICRYTGQAVHGLWAFRGLRLGRLQHLATWSYTNMFNPFLAWDIWEGTM